MQGLPRNQRRAATGATPTPPPVAVASDPPQQAPGRPEAGAAGPTRSAAPGRGHAAFWLVMLLAAATSVAVVVARALQGMPPIAVATWRTLLSVGDAMASDRLSGNAAPRPEALFATPEEPAPTAKVRHDGYASIRGGVLFTPATFSPDGSNYDLLLHFHGNTQVMRESAEIAGLNAAVAVVNLGIGSGPYEEAYAVPGTYEALLEEINQAVAQRGVRRPRLRRLAISSWSAGYGAISKILDVRRGTDPLDAILVTDGIHTGWLGTEHERWLNPLPLTPFARAAQAAASGALLFSITHSEVDPPAYVGTALTADYLLTAAAGHPVTRAPSKLTPVHLTLRSAEGAVSKKLEKHMIPTTEAHVGGLHVRGFRGNTPEHHMAHLLQIGATVLPELAARWKGAANAAPVRTKTR